MKFRFAYRSYCAAFRNPVRTAHNLWTERTGLILRLTDEEGSVGFGEAAPIPWFGTETVGEIEGLCRGFGESITDEQMAEVPSSLGCLRGALQAAKENLLKATPDQPPRIEAGAGYLTVAALLPAGRAALSKIPPLADAGFRTFKWKVGVDELAEELPLMDDVIAALPNGAKLRLDANGAWDRRRAERWLERCADRPIEFLEQPIAPDARGAEDLLLGLAGDYPTPLALDESVAVSAQIERWLRLGWAGIFVVKPTLLGNAVTMLERLRAAKAAVVFSSALETAVGAQRALRMAFNYDGPARALGFGVWPLFKDARLDGPHVAPFIRREDVAALNPENVWNALS